MFRYGGYIGKLLRVNLSKNEVKIENLREELAEEYLGGRGFGVRILLNEVGSKIDPFDPKNKVILATGPLTGTTTPSAPKYTLTTKSPLTGILLQSSASGYFAPELKFAGYDCVVIEGRAEQPSYLWINEGNVEIKEAPWLWGLTTDVAQRLLKEVTDSRAQIACIGPAGEHLVRYAGIICDWRALARGGAGAVLGSKRLKAIAVRGEGKELRISNSKEFNETVDQVYEIIRKDPLTSEIYPKYGTTHTMQAINAAGMYPTKNFQEAIFKGAERTSPEALRNKMFLRSKSCYRCPIACTKISAVKDGPYAGATTRGPEYETLWAFSAQCANDSLEAVIAANELCDRMGIDTISAGNVIGFAMECFEKGLITKEDTDGAELSFGNAASMLELIRKIAYRKGIGNTLAEGVRLASQRIGKDSERFAMHVKGMELPAYDPRGAWGMGLAYATANRGGCHLTAWTISTEVYSGRYERFSIEEKAKIVKEEQDIRAAVACTGLCIFAVKAMPLQTRSKIISSLVSSVTGIELSKGGFLEIGRRVYDLERLYNVNAGISRKDDTLPARIFEESVPEGPAKGQVIKRQDFEKMLDEYYLLREWSKNGIPTGQK